jgi:hypothetical protein
MDDLEVPLFQETSICQSTINPIQLFAFLCLSTYRSTVNDKSTFGSLEGTGPFLYHWFPTTFSPWFAVAAGVWHRLAVVKGDGSSDALGACRLCRASGGKQNVELAGINQLGLPDNLWETKCQWSIIILHCVGGNQPSCLDKTMFFWENKWVGNRWVGVVGCLSNFELGFLKECPPKSGWVSAQKQQVGRNDLFCIILRSAFSGYTCGAIPLAKQDFHL